MPELLDIETGGLAFAAHSGQGRATSIDGAPPIHWTGGAGGSPLDGVFAGVQGEFRAVESSQRRSAAATAIGEARRLGEYRAAIIGTDQAGAAAIAESGRQAAAIQTPRAPIGGVAGR